MYQKQQLAPSGWSYVTEPHEGLFRNFGDQGWHVLRFTCLLRPKTSL